MRDDVIDDGRGLAATPTGWVRREEEEPLLAPLPIVAALRSGPAFRVVRTLGLAAA